MIGMDPGLVKGGCDLAPVCGVIAKPRAGAKTMGMNTSQIEQIAATLRPGERAALAALPVRDTGYLDEENWWLFYILLDAGLLQGSDDMVMRRTPLGEAVLQHIQAGIS